MNGQSQEWLASACSMLREMAVVRDGLQRKTNAEEIDDVHAMFVGRGRSLPAELRTLCSLMLTIHYASKREPNINLWSCGLQTPSPLLSLVQWSQSVRSSTGRLTESHEGLVHRCKVEHLRHTTDYSTRLFTSDGAFMLPNDQPLIFWGGLQDRTADYAPPVLFPQHEDRGVEV